MEHDVVLAGEGLRLRPFRDDAADRDFLVRVADDPPSRQWSRSLRGITDDATARAWLARRLGDADSREWVVEDGEIGRVLGRVGLHRFDDGPFEVGYWTLPAERGTGVARRATRAVAHYAHDVLGQQRVGLVHAVANPASCRVAMAASFVHEGTLRRALDHGDGVLWDMHVHGRVVTDPWDAIPPAVPPGGPPLVEGNGIGLRPWTLADAGALRAAATDPSIQRWNPIRVDSDDDLHDFVDRMSFGMTNLGWAVVDPAADVVLGYVSLHHLDPANSSAEAGYWVAPHARGRGVGARALDTAASYAFTDLGVERIELFHAVENPHSCVVAERAGFALEGTRLLGYRYPDGALHDEHLHARLRDR